MRGYRHLLLALDFAEECAEVAHKAIELARQTNAKLSVVHVLDNIAMPDTGYGAVISLQNTTDDPALAAEKKRYQEMLDDYGVASQDAWMVWGNPQQEIVALANKLGVDLIVLGSHGRHGLALLLGSTANAVLHHAECDVLAVRVTESD